MKYKDSKKVNNYLNGYKDIGKIAAWAKAEISLATRETYFKKII